MDAYAWCQMSCRIHREPAGDILSVKIESFAREPNEWIEDGAPSDLIPAYMIVEMASPDRIFSQEQAAVVRVPDGKRPLTNEFRETFIAPSFKCRRDNLNIS